MQPGCGGQTYKVRVGGLLELLLGAVTDVCIWRRRQSVELAGAQWQAAGGIPGEKVPSNTWLISMIAGGCVCV
jgi:hypothetical protein